jgi:DNA sulfur modification protein DndD
MEEKLTELSQKHHIPLKLLQDVINYEMEKVILQKRPIDPLIKLIEQYAEISDQYVTPKVRKTEIHQPQQLKSLKLQKIYLKNWRCYQNQVITFDLKNPNHIWIIFGQNGFGKTSILDAIIWCLYGNNGISIQKLEESFNRVAIQENPELEMSVQLLFKGDEKYYHISRIGRRVKRGNHFQVIVEEPSFYLDGQEQSDSRSHIESFLPKSCKDFFFFDGVKIESYAEMIQSQDSREAIERILRIPEFKNLRDDFKRVIKQLEKQLNEASRFNQELQQVTHQLREQQDHLDLARGQLQERKKEYHASITIWQGLQETANQMQDLRGKLDELAKRETERKQLEERSKKINEEIDLAIRKAPISLMLDFVKELADDLQRKTLTSAKRSGSVAELQRLIDADLCLCGRCIDDEIRNYIRQQLEAIEMTGNFTEKAITQDNLRTNLQLIARYEAADLDGLLLESDRLLEKLEEVNQAINRLKSDTVGITEQEANQTWKQLGGQEKVVKENQDRLYQLETEIENLEKEENQLSRQRSNLASYNQETANLAKQIHLAKGIFQATDELIEWRITQCQETIERKTSEIHRAVTNKPEEYVGIKINPDYSIGIENSRGEIIKPEVLSAGEKEALAFAFITGLNLASGTAAPLIMDTPFGHLDTQHQQNIVNCLPDLPSQVIVLATDRDFPDSLLRGLRPHIADIFQIHRLGASDDGSAID